MASVAGDCIVGAFAVIEDGVVLGSGTRIGHHTVIGANTLIGPGSAVGSHTVIGSSGFGFEYELDQAWHRIPHVGGVQIGADVEIGSCVVIARGTIDDTVIEDQVKIDDHVFVAHNVRIGKNTLVVAGSELSGSVTVGEQCWIAPQVAVKNGVTIGANNTIGIGCVVLDDTPDNAVVVGNPGRILRMKTEVD